MQGNKMFKVLSPIEKTDKKTNAVSTYWLRCGVAFTNKDSSINVFLDVLPKDGKLQLRDFDEEDRREPRRMNAASGATSAGATDSVPF